MLALEPGWFFSLKTGAGGGGALLGAFFGEVELLPIPFVITPTFGFGVSAIVGAETYKLDPWIYSLAPRTDLRIVPYGAVGIRVDAGSHFTLALNASLTASGNMFRPLTAFPGFRIGYRF